MAAPAVISPGITSSTENFIDMDIMFPVAAERQVLGLNP
jgi:hypothetical protein